MTRFKREDIGVVGLIILVVVALLLQMVLVEGAWAQTSTPTSTGTPTATYTPAPIKYPAAGITGLGGIRFAPDYSYQLGNNGTIPCSRSYVPLTTAAGSAAATSSIAAGVAGQVLIITNVNTNTITITDTGTTMLTGNIALGQYDTLTVLFDGTNWLQLSTANN